VPEASGVEPVFAGPNGRDNAIGYAKTRQGFSRGEIRVQDKTGALVHTIPFDGTQKTL
jgi:hypothetical protein